MRKLDALKKFILDLSVVSEENIQGWHVIEEYKPSGIAASGTAVCIYDQSYQAIIRIERFPVEHGIDVFLANLAIWFRSYDPMTYRFKVNRADGNPIPLPDCQPNMEEESSETFAIELLVMFREPVFGVADLNGKHVINGINYRFATDEEASELESGYILEVDYDSVDWRRNS